MCEPVISLSLSLSLSLFSVELLEECEGMMYVDGSLFHQGLIDPMGSICSCFHPNNFLVIILGVRIPSEMPETFVCECDVLYTIWWKLLLREPVIPSFSLEGAGALCIWVKRTALCDCAKETLAAWLQHATATTSVQCHHCYFSHCHSGLWLNGIELHTMVFIVLRITPCDLTVLFTLLVDIMPGGSPVHQAPHAVTWDVSYSGILE